MLSIRIELKDPNKLDEDEKYIIGELIKKELQSTEELKINKDQKYSLELNGISYGITLSHAIIKRYGKKHPGEYRYQIISEYLGEGSYGSVRRTMFYIIFDKEDKLLIKSRSLVAKKIKKPKDDKNTDEWEKEILNEAKLQSEIYLTYPVMFGMHKPHAQKKHLKQEQEETIEDKAEDDKAEDGGYLKENQDDKAEDGGYLEQGSEYFITSSKKENEIDESIKLQRTSYTFTIELTGKDLSKIIGRINSLAQRYQIALVSLQGLEKIHAKDIVHRDLNLNNIKFDEEKITSFIFDFGKAKKINDKKESSYGKFNFMPPEAAQTYPATGFYSDIFHIAGVIGLILANDLQAPIRFQKMDFGGMFLGFNTHDKIRKTPYNFSIIFTLPEYKLIPKPIINRTLTILNQMGDLDFNSRPDLTHAINELSVLFHQISIVELILKELNSSGIQFKNNHPIALMAKSLFQELFIQDNENKSLGDILTAWIDRNKNDITPDNKNFLENIKKHLETNFDIVFNPSLTLATVENNFKK